MDDPRCPSLSGEVEEDGEAPRALSHITQGHRPLPKPMDNVKGHLDVEEEGEMMAPRALNLSHIPQGHRPLPKPMDNVKGHLDVEEDGEMMAPRALNLSHIPQGHRPLPKPMYNVKGHLDKYECEPSMDSGLGSVSLCIDSVSPGASLCSQASMPSIPEKLSVQCSDGPSPGADLTDSGVAAVTAKLTMLSTAYHADDEGIYSMTESLPVETNINYINDDEIEIDLFETDSDGDSLIHTAIINETVCVALVFIQLAEDSECLNIQNELFQTPLHLATLTYQPEVAKCLVANECDVMLRDKQGNTALHIACRKGDYDIVQTIVDSLGNDKDRRKKLFAIRNCEGLTSLHLASQNKQYSIMGYLFAKGADVNIGDAKSGRTILHYAAERKDLETVLLLLTHSDLDIDSRTYNGETALVLAFWRNYQDIVRKLRKKGAYFSYDMFEDSDGEGGS